MTLANPSVLHPVIKRLFEKRGISLSDIGQFLSMSLRELPDLKNLKDMNKAAYRIVQAIEKKESIVIYGDYDVDGATSLALFYHFFQFFGIEVTLLQPSRFVEGYGLHPSSIEQARELKASLIISVDCGITSFEAAEQARAHNIDLIITDHHKDTLPQMPDAFAVIDPFRRDESNTELECLAGVGVAFCLCLSIRDIVQKTQSCPSIYPLLQFVALGSICDLAALTPVNLKLIRHGLKQMPSSLYPGIKIFFNQEEREHGYVSSEKLSFTIGPMINAQGRMDHPERALKLLTCANAEEAFAHYSALSIQNRERKSVQAQIFQKAKEAILEELKSGPLDACVVYDKSWHEGVIGIVASKLVETFKIPSVVLTHSEEKGILKGSARTAGDLHLYSILKQLEDLFLKFGGHKAAAGFSIKEENFPLFKERFTTMLSAVPLLERSVIEHVDLEITSQDICPDLAKELELLGPYGPSNPKPIFKTKNLKLDKFEILKEKHVRWYFSCRKNPLIKFQGISFNYIHAYSTIHPSKLLERQSRLESISIHFNLDINRFRGNEYLQLFVHKIYPE